MVQWIKHLLYKTVRHEELSSIPRTHVKVDSVKHICNLGTSIVGWEIKEGILLEALRLVSLAYIVVNERPCLK